jgi:desulfoferrodoxin (superoxide reductase-like protein)
MKTLIHIPSDRHDSFLERCPAGSREYEILKNAVVTHGQEDGHFIRTIHLLCKPKEVQMLLDFAVRFYPDAVSDIAKGMGLIG